MIVCLTHPSERRWPARRCQSRWFYLQHGRWRDSGHPAQCGATRRGENITSSSLLGGEKVVIPAGTEKNSSILACQHCIYDISHGVSHAKERFFITQELVTRRMTFSARQNTRAWGFQAKKNKKQKNPHCIHRQGSTHKSTHTSTFAYILLWQSLLGCDDCESTHLLFSSLKEKMVIMTISAGIYGNPAACTFRLNELNQSRAF